MIEINYAANTWRTACRSIIHKNFTIIGGSMVQIDEAKLIKASNDSDDYENYKQLKFDF